MLVLSRKRNESIVIDGNITITVVRTGRNSVRLGIDAPEEIRIDRSEVFAEIAKARAEETAADWSES